MCSSDLPVVGEERAGGQSSVYRLHLDSPIPFTKSIRATIEHGHANHRSDNFYSVAYWYQTEPHAPFPVQIGRASCRERVSMSVGAEAEDGIRDDLVTGVQTCALPIFPSSVKNAPVASRRCIACIWIRRFPLQNQYAPLLSMATLITARTISILWPTGIKPSPTLLFRFRSEERRVGKECQCRLAPKQKTAYEMIW